MRFSDMTIRTLAPPAKGQKTYFDDTLPGFGCRISQGGTRSFVAMHGRSRQLTTIGRYPLVSLSSARQRAKEILAEQVLGQTRAPSHISFGEAAERFLASHDGRESTKKEYARLLNKHFVPRFRLEPIERVTTADLTRIIDKLADTPSVARHAYAVVMALFNWALSRRTITRNPLAGVRPPKLNPSRERALTDDELAIVLAKARACPFSIGQIVQLLILTGQRRGEIGSLRRSYINTDAMTITWPGHVVKNGRTHTIPYGPMVATLVEQVKSDGDLFFPARGSEDKPYCGWSRMAMGFAASTCIPPWTLHDLRRTFASGMQRLGVRVEVTEKLLNHVSGTFSGITGVYQRHAYLDEMRDALGNWETHLTQLLQKAGGQA